MRRSALIKYATASATRASDRLRSLSIRQPVTGNQASLRALRQAPAFLRRKLEIGAAADPLEHVADRVADDVMRMADAPASAPSVGRMLQRKCAACEEKDESKLQPKRPPSAGGAAIGAAPRIVHDALRTPGEPLDAGARAFMEPRFGRDFGDVRVHADTRASDSARAVNAMAYTVGRDVVFAAGRYAPQTAAGRRLLAHELAHVVQQGGSIAHGQLQRQPATSPGEASSTTPATPPTPLKPCPLLSDFASENEAGFALMCVTKKEGEAPTCALTNKHLEMLATTRTLARQRVQKAYFRIYATGGPEYAQRIARSVFVGEPPDTDTIRTTLDTMISRLQSMTFVGGTCAAPECDSPGAHALAFEDGPGNPVTVCLRSFLPVYLPQLTRTLIHETVHLAGIDVDPDVEEVYCKSDDPEGKPSPKDCEQQCQAATSADAWARFIDCLGGPLLSKYLVTGAGAG
jgi:hypothetical protein